VEKEVRLVEDAQRIGVARRAGREARKLVEVHLRVFVEGLADHLAVAQVKGHGRAGHERARGAHDLQQAHAVRAGDHDVNGNRREGCENRVLLRHHGEDVGKERRGVEPGLAAGGRAREKPERQHHEERRQQDRALHQVADGVHRRRVDREEADRDRQRPGALECHGRRGGSVRVRARLDPPQHLAVEPPQHEHDRDVDGEIHDPLLPPPVPEQRLHPYEAAVGQEPGLELEAAVFLEEGSVGEEGVVENQLVAEPRHVHQQHRQQHDRQPDQVSEGGAEGQNGAARAAKRKIVAGAPRARAVST
jgi:hypothetical protein